MSVIKLSSPLSSSTAHQFVFTLHKAESSSLPSSFEVVCLAVLPMTVPSKAVIVFWLHSVGFHLEQFFTVWFCLS